MSSLTQRAQQAAGANPVVATGANTPAATLTDQIRAMEDQFALAMPKGAEAAQLVRDALTCLKMTPDLAKCTPASVLGSLMTCAQLGLRPGVLGHAYVIPFRDRQSGTHQAQLIVGYKGVVELAYRSPSVASVIARTVYEGDTFDVDYGLDDSLIHKPAMEAERTDPTAHYAIVKFNNGGRVFWVMSEAEMQAWRKKYGRAGSRSPWVTDYEAMARKTVLLRLAAWMPKSTEMAYAIEVDNGVRTNVDPAATLTEVTHVYRDGEEPPAETVQGEVEPDGQSGVQA